MTDEELLSMLADITNELDYDLFKAVFVPECEEEEGAQEAMQERLLSVARSHLDE